MAADKSTKNYEDWYARLLLLYPKKFKEQFSESMQQTFADLCNERKRSNDKMFSFVAGTFAETFVGIIKECSKEVVMNSKANKTKLVLGAIVSLLLVVGLGFFLTREPSSGVIKPFSSYREATKQTSAKKNKCLADSQEAISAVGKDDSTFGDTGDSSNFAYTTADGFLDVPAGTYFDVTISSYDGGVALGSILYSEPYGNYNYTLKKQAEADKWEFVSMVACEK